MKITSMFLTPNQYSRPQSLLKKINGVVVHYVGNAGSTALGNRNYFESLKDKKTYASSHYVIGLEGEIIQCIPEKEIAYCSNQRNDDTISIECCHPLADGKFNESTYHSLIELVSDICVRYNLSPQKDVIRHYDVTGKKCPLYYVNVPSAWETLKVDIGNFMNKDNTAEVTEAMEALNSLSKKGFLLNPDYWKSALNCVKNLDVLFIHFEKKCTSPKGNIHSVEEALKKLSAVGIINLNADITDTLVVVKNFDSLLIKAANWI